MMEVLSLVNVRKVGKMGLVSGCLIVTIVGCSSRLQTTIMSGVEPPPEPQVAKLESVPPPTEVAVPAPVQPEKMVGIPPIDIPVEEPARPVIRPSAPAEIFATPRTGVVEPAVSAPLEAPLVPEPVAPPSPIMASPPSEPSPQESPIVQGIPPISYEPEMPALPTIREQEEVAPPEELIARVEPEPVPDIVSPPISPMEEKPISPMEDKPIEPVVEEAPKPQEPVQVAKVVPVTPETIEKKEDFLMALGDVYFDYDRFSIRNDAIPVLKENAQALVEGLSGKDIVIEGHCDERGTESYNMVLGERRASAVKEFLVDLGVPGDKLQVVSYGKERPVCTDQNEQCWQENRRGHFVLQ